MDVTIKLTYEQMDTLTDLVEEKRDMWARIVADALIEKREQEAIDRRATKYAKLSSLNEAIYRNSETN